MTESLRWWDKLNRAVFPFMGPAQLGRMDGPIITNPEGRPCPLCGSPMNAHTIDRPGHNVASRLHCPA